MNALDVSQRPRARKFVPTTEEAAAMDSTQRSCDWFWNLPPEELRKYYNQTLAIRECQVVSTAPTLEELLPKISSLDMKSRSRATSRTRRSPSYPASSRS